MQVHALADEAIAGFVVAGMPRDGEAPAAPELQALNVVREHRSTGLTDELLHLAADDRQAYLWVLGDNDRTGLLPPTRISVDATTRPHTPTGVIGLRMPRAIAHGREYTR